APPKPELMAKGISGWCFPDLRSCYRSSNFYDVRLRWFRSVTMVRGYWNVISQHVNF
ncbi:hypothetical protein J6590_097852, partial [Homalodisca vitripennis]